MAVCNSDFGGYILISHQDILGPQSNVARIKKLELNEEKNINKTEYV